MITFHIQSLDLNSVLLASGPNSSPRLSPLCGPAPVSLAGLMFITELFQPLAFLFLKHSEFILLTSI